MVMFVLLLIALVVGAVVIVSIGGIGIGCCRLRRCDRWHYHYHSDSTW